MNAENWKEYLKINDKGPQKRIDKIKEFLGTELMTKTADF